MDPNQHQQFLGNPFKYPNTDTLVTEEALGKRKALDDGECSQCENDQRIVKIPKIDNEPINLAPNRNTRQGNMMRPPAKPSTFPQRDHASNALRNNPINNVLDMEYQEFVAAIRRPPSPNSQRGEYCEFSKQFDDKMILGPYATEVDLAAYRKINFRSAKIATRQLLVLVFPSHILATHSLTGRTSPSTRSNTIKMQLDTIKVEDIIHCVLSENNCNRQDITAACWLYKNCSNEKYNLIRILL